MKNDCGKTVELNRSDLLEKVLDDDEVMYYDPFNTILIDLGISQIIIDKINTIKLNVAGFETDLD